MRDLWIPPGPGLPDGLRVPAGELAERFSRSPGPGGQSVNTTDSRVEVSWDPASSTALDAGQRARVMAKSYGPIVLVAHEHRSQHRNRIAARERLAAKIRELLAPPSPQRRATRPTRGSQRRRLESKKRRSRTKQLRGRVEDT